LSLVNGTGFLLTRNQYDKAGKCTFEFWVKSAQGTTQLLVEGEKAVFFVRTTDLPLVKELCQLNRINIEDKNLPLVSFQQEPMTALYASSLRNYQLLRKALRAQQIEIFEDDIKPVDRYLMERFIQGGIAYSGAHGRGAACLNFAKIKSFELETDIELSHLSIDIECDETGYLYSIGLYGVDEREQEYKKVLFNIEQVEKVSSVLPAYMEWCRGEKELLLRFCEEVQLYDPDLLIGWNFIKFDIRVLVKAAQRAKVELLLGRDGSALNFQDGSRDGEARYPDKAYVSGRVVLDGIEVMKNATYHFPSFSLNNVANEVLSESKLITGEDGLNKLAEIKRQYKEEPVKLAEYNLQDCRLVSLIFIKEKLFEYLITRTKLTGLELDRVGGSVAAFTNLYLPHVHRSGWIAPNLVAPEDYVHSPGGFVMDSQPGIHNDVLVFDFKSLYPSIIRTFNVDPIGLLEAKALPEKDTIEGFRGGRFNRSPSRLALILDKLWQAREKAKQDKNMVFSNAIKIIMNSFYGVLGSSGCRFYDTKLASSITMRGHWILNESKSWFESQGLNVIYGDTDSIFVSLDNSNYDASSAQSLEVELNQWWKDKLKREFQIDCKLEMEFETHFAPFFMPTIRGSESGSKKRYAGIKVNQENKQLIFKGMESVRSDWTELAKRFQETLYAMVFDKEDCETFILNTIDSLKSGELDHQLIYKKKIRQPLSSYVKTTPPQIKAARLANSFLSTDKYKKGTTIHYVITTNGPIAINTTKYKVDYQHYIEKQLLPIAESILSIYDYKALKVFNKQLPLI
jgi:DNA polymerase-2